MTAPRFFVALKYEVPLRRVGTKRSLIKGARGMFSPEEAVKI